ncbi:MAG: ExeM/NucH family extracellular endonuclease [Anaerolineae bacterium]|nr:ExeM/NucH family extracellular endonuclease [Anaerolineae bacterium]
MTDAAGLQVVDRSGIENGSISLLLVKNFSGAIGDDLDTDDDGVLDFMPWTDLVDSVAVSDGGGADLHYAEVTLSRGYDGIDYVPGGASRFPDGFDTDSASDWVRNDYDGAGLPGYDGTPELGEAFNTPGLPNELVPEPPALTCDEPVTSISAVQGSGSASPLVGTQVVVEGVVVADFQGNDALGGFFLQDPAGDGDPTTSDGIFVYDDLLLDVSVGDVVRAQAYVSEYYDLTELSGVDAMLVCGSAALPAPAPVSLPVTDTSDWEAYEGMLVELNQTLTVTENYTLGRYGEVVLSAGGRLWNPTNVTLPGAAANALQAQNDLRRIQLDDGRTAQNPVPLPPYFAADGTLRAGDTTQVVQGVMHYSFGAYEIHPVQPVIFVRNNPRPVTPAPVGGELQVASFNVLNYFNGDGQGGGFPTSRGALDQDDFDRQRAKIIAAIVELDADVIGLMEIENDGYGSFSAIQDLVNGLNAVAGAGTYAFAAPETGAIGTDEITVGLLYKPAVVTPFGAAFILDSSVDPAFIDTKNRPTLIQTFEEVATGARFTVAVNHLKSKGSDCDDLGDIDLGDGQGNCNLTRLAAANALVNVLASDPTGSGDPDFLIIGDLNSYAMEDPIMAIRGAGYADLLQKFVGAEAYSYVFGGQAGYLDHALAIENLVTQVTGATVWHINADEPTALDYQEYNQDALYQPHMYRSSDHDPVLVGMLLDIELELDVKPGNSTDPVNFGSNGKLPVAIYSTPQVNATLIAPETILLAGAPIAQTGRGYMVQYRDVNGDGLVDLFAHFELAQMEIPVDGSPLAFEGVYDGRRVYGTDEVQAVPVGGMSCAFSQEAWETVFGPEGPQAEFLYGRTVAQVLEVRGNGHRWYNLAQAVITTRLLEAEGVEIPSGLAVTLVEAESRLAANSPDQGMRRNDRLIFEDLADVLNAFNAAAGCAP